MPNRIERFTLTVRSALASAQVEAENLQHPLIGPEHLLLGLMRDKHSGAAEILSELQLDSVIFQHTISELSASQTQVENVRLDLSAQAKQVLVSALEKARAQGAQSVGTAHLLLALMSLEDGIMIEALKLQNVDPQEVSKLTNERLKQAPIPPQELETSGIVGATPKASETTLGLRLVLPWRPKHDNTDHFTERAMQVLALAREEAERYGYHVVGTQHLLLGMIRQSDSIAGRVLRDLGMKQLKIRASVEGKSPVAPLAQNVTLELGDDVKKTLEYAVSEARLLNHDYVGTEHLLLGMAHHANNAAMDILQQQNITPLDVRRHTRRVLQGLVVSQPSAAQHRKQAVGKPPQTGLERVLTRFVPGEWRTVLDNAQTQAIRRLHANVLTAHVLLALLLDSHNRAGHILRTMGLTVNTATKIVDDIPAGEVLNLELSFSPYLIGALGYAVAEAFRTGSAYLRTEHLLLGLLAQEGSKALDILKAAGIAPDEVRRRVLDTLNFIPFG